MIPRPVRAPHPIRARAARQIFILSYRRIDVAPLGESRHAVRNRRRQASAPASSSGIGRTIVNVSPPPNVSVAQISP